MVARYDRGIEPDVLPVMAAPRVATTPVISSYMSNEAPGLDPEHGQIERERPLVPPARVEVHHTQDDIGAVRRPLRVGDEETIRRNQ